MRAAVDELISPHPLGAMLPGIYQGDDFAQRFTAGLDDVIAPVLSTLDNLAAYFDPATAPDDFLDFIAHWVGIDVEASWSVTRRRRVISHALELHRGRGTPHGIRAAVALVTRAPVQVSENGAAAWSQTPGSQPPGDATPRLVVRIDTDELSELERRRIDALVAAVKPAYVPHEIELGPVVQDERAMPKGSDMEEGSDVADQSDVPASLADGGGEADATDRSSE